MPLMNYRSVFFLKTIKTEHVHTACGAYGPGLRVGLPHTSLLSTSTCELPSCIPLFIEATGWNTDIETHTDTHLCQHLTRKRKWKKQKCKPIADCPPAKNRGKKEIKEYSFSALSSHTYYQPSPSKPLPFPYSYSYCVGNNMYAFSISWFSKLLLEKRESVQVSRQSY